MLNTVCSWCWDHIFLATLICIVAYFLFKNYTEGAQYTKRTKCLDKVILITGANTGIGKETALELARRGGKIYMACRSLERGFKACEEIKMATGNPNVFVRELDLASFDSIRQFVEKFKTESERLDILINNAGVYGTPKSYTKDGLELQLGTNHFGHFLLTNLLLDYLKTSEPSRIINVSSFWHFWGEIDEENLNSEKSYGPHWAYCNSKLANVLFTKELARRLKGSAVTVNTLHPGVVITEVTRHSPILHYMIKFVAKSAKSGSQTTLYCALDPDLENVTGKYFKECREAKSAKLADDEELARWLWNVSEKLTGLSSKFQ